MGMMHGEARVFLSGVKIHSQQTPLTRQFRGQVWLYDLWKMMNHD